MQNQLNRHKIVSFCQKLFYYYGFFSLVSLVFVNPWWDVFIKNLENRWAHDFKTPAVQYFVVCLLLGPGLIFFGKILNKVRRKFHMFFICLVGILCVVFLFDRLVLVKYGLSIWISDPVVHARHRPNSVRQWRNEYGPNDEVKYLKTNRYGYHDDDFPLLKPDDEFRVLVLGDSVVLGPHANLSETFCEQLQSLMSKRQPSKKYYYYQVMNTGIIGYGLEQQYEIFQEMLRFKPDMVFATFTLSDLVEDYVRDKKLGGSGFNNEGIIQVPNSFIGYLFHETGIGRLLLSAIWSSVKSSHDELKNKYTIEHMLENMDEEWVGEAFQRTLGNLQNIYDLGKTNNLEVVLIVSPRNYQLVAGHESLIIQKTVRDHAIKNGIEVIDLAPVFGQLWYLDIRNEILKGASAKDVDQFATRLLLKYFVDPSHYTPEGHRIIAELMYDSLKRKKLF